MVNKFFNFLRAEKQETPLTKSTYSRKFEVSPIFSFSNVTAIAVSSETILDFETLKPKSGKYLPFNSGRILNNSDSDIIIYINQNRERPLQVPANTIQPVDATIFPSISSAIIVNNDTNEIPIGKINLVTSKDEVTVDLIAKRMHKLLLDRGV